jgi:hypothetical protein
MRLSLLKGAHMALSSAAWQEIRVRSGRDDKFVLKSMISYDNPQFCNKIVIPTGA